MIQDVSPRRFGNEFLPVEPADGDTVLDLDEDGLLLNEGRLPLVREWRLFGAEQDASLIYAFRLTDEKDAAPAADALPPSAPEKNETRFFLVRRPAGERALTPGPWQRVAPSALRNAPPPLPLVAATARHLHEWYDTHRFCPRCAAPLKHAATERALVCPACRHVLYPVIAPCVIVAVTHGDRLLLTRYARPGARHLVLVAGFVEVGETAEQAAAREVMEETGLRIKNLRYAGSQPWGLSGTLAAGFVAELDGPDTIRLDTSELAEARWLKRADIPPLPGTDSLTMDMIARFIRGEL